MSVIEDNFQGDDYEIVAWANNEEVLYYNKFGSYQGEWVLFTYGKDHRYRIYEGSYGSCSGCDSFQAVFDYVSGKTKEKAKEFAADYHPFLDIPYDTMCNIVMANDLLSVFPKNIRDGFGQIPYDQVAPLVTTIIKLREKLSIELKDIFVANAEVSRRALEQYGEERFVSQCEIMEERGVEKLLRIQGRLYVYIQDASTSRHYLLRVPPNMGSIHEAIAWTFNIDPRFYKPEKET